MVLVVIIKQPDAIASIPVANNPSERLVTNKTSDVLYSLATSVGLAFETNLSKTYLRPKQEAHVRVGKNYQACIPELNIPTHIDKIKIYNIQNII